MARRSQQLYELQDAANAKSSGKLHTLYSICFQESLKLDEKDLNLEKQFVLNAQL